MTSPIVQDTKQLAPDRHSEESGMQQGQLLESCRQASIADCLNIDEQCATEEICQDLLSAGQGQQPKALPPSSHQHGKSSQNVDSIDAKYDTHHTHPESHSDCDKCTIRDANKLPSDNEVPASIDTAQCGVQSFVRTESERQQFLEGKVLLAT